MWRDAASVLDPGRADELAALLVRVEAGTWRRVAEDQMSFTLDGTLDEACRHTSEPARRGRRPPGGVVGDHRFDDVFGASRLGCTALVRNPDARWPADNAVRPSEVRPDATIGALPELLRWVVDRS